MAWKRWTASLLAGACVFGTSMTPAMAAQSYWVDYDAGVAALERHDDVTAEECFARAVAGVPEADRARFRFDVDAKRAALYIKNGEPERAETILAPYVLAGTDNMKVVSDYLMALRMGNKPKEAMAYFETHCNDWGKMPVYGLPNMGDIYLRQGKWRQAHALYAYTLPQSDNDFVRMGDAYALGHLGQKEAALAEYQMVIERNPVRRAIVPMDAAAFLQEGDLAFARKMFALLGTTTEEREQYQLQYAETLLDVQRSTIADAKRQFLRDERLAGRDYHHEIDKVLAPLLKSKNENVRAQALALRARNQLQRGAVGSAKKMLQTSLEQDADAPAAFRTGSDVSTTALHELSVTAGENVDTDTNHFRDIGVDYRQYLSGNLYALVGTGWSHTEDDDVTGAYVESYAGFDWRQPWGFFQLTYDRANGDIEQNGYHALLRYDVHDLTGIELESGRHPYDAARAICAGIYRDAYALRFDHLLTNRWRLGLTGERADISDGNDWWSLGLATSLDVGARHNYRDQLLASYSYSHYDEQVEAYNSPDRRVEYAFGCSRKWMLPRLRASWEFLPMLGWNQEDDEGTEFSPTLRLVYRRDFAQGQSLALGLQYDWRQQEPDRADTGRKKSGYSVDVSYDIGW